jgi:hypothetical protein
VLEELMQSSAVFVPATRRTSQKRLGTGLVKLRHRDPFLAYPCYEGRDEARFVVLRLLRIPCLRECLSELGQMNGEAVADTRPRL